MSLSRKQLSLSRKRQRQLKRLRNQAEELLEHQREVLGHAGEVVQEAGRQAKHLNSEIVMPRLEDAIDSARPMVNRRLQQAQRAADRARLVTAPFLAAALAGTVRSLERIESGEAARQVRSFGEQRGLLAPAKKKRGGAVALGLGIAAAGVVGYALWQAFRSDDELWVAPGDN